MKIARSPRPVAFALAVTVALAVLAARARAATPMVTSVSPAEAEQESLVIGVTVAGSSFEQGTMPNPPGAVEFNGHLYELVTDQKYWHDARDESAARGGHLVTITSSAEHNFLQTFSSRAFWLGFTDEAVEGQYRWVTAEPFSYSNWAVAQPDNGDLGPASDEDYGEMWTDGTTGRWNDGVPDEYRDFVCEYDAPPPPTVHLAISGENDIPAKNVRFVDSGTLVLDLDLTGAAVGDWDVVVTNPGSEYGALPAGFTVVELHSVVPEPVTGLMATEASLTRIDLAWVNPSDPNVTSVIVFRRTNAAPAFTPTDGDSYTIGTTYGDAVCVYDGAASAYSNSSLTADLTYHYVAYAHDADHTYSTAASASARVARPYIESRSPADQETGVSTGMVIEVTFSEPMNLSSAESACSVSGGVSGTFSWEGNTMRVTPDAPLTDGMLYSVTIAATAADANGVSMGAPCVFVFSTGPGGTGGDADTPFGGGCGAAGETSPVAWLVPVGLAALLLSRRPRKAASA